MGMVFAWLFITSAWVFAGWIYIKALEGPLNPVGLAIKVVAMMVIALGSLFVPDLWL